MNSASTRSKSAVAGDLQNFGDQAAGQPAAAEIRMHQHAHAANMPLPAPQPLMQRGRADDFFVNQAHQGQVAPVINVFAPVANDFGVLHAVFDEHPFGFGNALKQMVKLLFVVGLERPQHRLFAGFELERFWEFLQFEFNAE